MKFTESQTADICWTLSTEIGLLHIMSCKSVGNGRQNPGPVQSRVQSPGFTATPPCVEHCTLLVDRNWHTDHVLRALHVFDSPTFVIQKMYTILNSSGAAEQW